MVNTTSKQASLLGIILLAALLAASVISLVIIGLDSSSSTRNEDRKAEGKSYVIYTGYNHTVLLRPNIVYDNSSYLAEKPYVFLSLVKEVKLEYYVYMGGEGSLEGEYIVDVSMGDGGTWEKSLFHREPRSLNNSVHGSVSLNMTEAEEIINKVRKETRTFTPTYLLVLTIHLRGTASIAGQSTPIRINSRHTITLDYSANRLVFSDKTRRFTGNIAALPTTSRSGRTYVLGSPLPPYLMLISSVGGAGLVYYRFFAARTEDPDKAAEKEYRDIIVGAGNPPSNGRTVEVSSLEELARIGVMLEKPVLRGPGSYYVVDGDTLYTYRGNNRRSGEKNR